MSLSLYYSSQYQLNEVSDHLLILNTTDLNIVQSIPIPFSLFPPCKIIHREKGRRTAREVKRLLG
ncbi:MAG: hypothetical protein ACI89T_000752 [Cognaticolwellia sp.]|jgi:hypothetical protein